MDEKLTTWQSWETEPLKCVGKILIERSWTLFVDDKLGRSVLGGR